MPSSYQLEGYAFDRSGKAVSSADVKLFKAGTTTGALSSTTTGSDGKWTLNVSPAGSSVVDVDVEITNTQTGVRKRIKFSDKIMTERVYTRQLTLSPDSNDSGSSKGFFTTLVAQSAQGASHTITFPALTGTVVVATQGSSGAVTFGDGLTLSSGSLDVGGNAAIDSAGAITSTSTISAHGNITSSGDITGQTITAGDSLAISSGGINVNSGFFTVSSAGVVTSSGAYTAGGDISGQTVTAADSIEITGGGLKVNTDKFTVSSAGVVTSTGTASFHGAITSSGALTAQSMKLNNNALDVSSVGLAFIGDSANANMTVGLTINNGGNEDQEFTLKNTDVATGITTATVSQDVETDDILMMRKIGSAGGILLYTLGTSGSATPFFHESYGGAPSTTDNSASVGAMTWFVAQHDGANALVDMAANSNAFTWGEVESAGTRATRMLLKADDGELHLGNTTLVALDDDDDIQLVRSMQKLSASEGIIENQYDNPFYDYKYLQSKGLAGPMDESGFFLFPLQSRMHAHEGAIWQLATKLYDALDRLALAESKLAALPQGA